MALGATQSSAYVEGADKVGRFKLTGDSSYVTGGYDVLAAITALPGRGGIVIKRVISWRHTTINSKILGDAVFVDTYGSNGAINSLLMGVVVPAGTQLGNGSSAANLSIELIVEGYGF